MMKYPLFLISFLIQFHLFAQQKIDSLRTEWLRGSKDSQVRSALAISKYYLNINIDSAGWYAEQALHLALGSRELQMTNLASAEEKVLDGANLPRPSKIANFF